MIFYFVPKINLMITRLTCEKIGLTYCDFFVISKKYIFYKYKIIQLLIINNLILIKHMNFF